MTSRYVKIVDGIHAGTSGMLVWEGIVQKRPSAWILTSDGRRVFTIKKSIVPYELTPQEALAFQRLMFQIKRAQKPSKPYRKPRHPRRTTLDFL